MTSTRSRLLLPSSLLLLVIFILSPVSLPQADAQASPSSPSCDTLHQCDFYWGEWSACSATCSGTKRRNATVCCPPSSGTLQLCRERCAESFRIISSSQSDRAMCRCVNGGVRSASGACDCPPGYYGNCCQEKTTYPDTSKDTHKEEEEGGQPDQLNGDSGEHGCHGSHENQQHDGSCEDNDDSDDGQGHGSSNNSKTSLHAGAVAAIVLVTLGSLIGACVLIAVLCHSKYKKRVAAAAAASVTTGATTGTTTGVVIVKPPTPAVYTIDVKQKKKMADDVTASPPTYWQAVEASAPPSYQSYMALNEVGLDDQARSARN